MNAYQAVIGVLALAVMGLAIGLGFAMMDDDGMHGDRQGYMGMMAAMGNMDSDAMLERMRETLNDEEYAAMLEHMAEHRAGRGVEGGAGIDGMMHRMMDGMMGEMGYPGGGMMNRN